MYVWTYYGLDSSILDGLPLFLPRQTNQWSHKLWSSFVLFKHIIMRRTSKRSAFLANSVQTYICVLCSYIPWIWPATNLPPPLLPLCLCVCVHKGFLCRTSCLLFIIMQAGENPSHRLEIMLQNNLKVIRPQMFALFSPLFLVERGCVWGLPPVSRIQDPVVVVVSSIGGGGREEMKSFVLGFLVGGFFSISTNCQDYYKFIKDILALNVCMYLVKKGTKGLKGGGQYVTPTRHL